MEKIRIKNLLGLLIFTLITLFAFNFQVKLMADENMYANDYAYYKVNETLEQSEIYDGVEYQHDSVVTAVTDQSKIIGYECGGATYSDKPFIANHEYTQSAYVLTVPADSHVKVVVWSVVNNGKWTLSNILTTAKDFEAHNPGYKVIAGINGDFFDINAGENYPYTTLGAWISNGEVYKADVDSGRSLGFNNNGSTTPYSCWDGAKASEKPTLYVFDQSGEVVYEKLIDKVNDVVSVGETALYYGEYDNNHRCNSIDVEGAYIVENSYKQIAYSKTSFYGKGEISKIGNATLIANQFAIKTNDSVLNEYLKAGTIIKVQYNFDGDLANTELTGYVTSFLKDGQHYETDANYEYMDYRYPRTLVGYREDGTLVMACTDGRQADKGFYGLNGVESSAQMAYYGCTTALSLDGGGSTTMVILKDGELTAVNSPSDGSLRNDGNAIFIVAPVPKVEMECKASDSTISVKLNVLEMITDFKELYIEVNGEKKKFEEKELIFENLKSNKKYAVCLYGKDGDDFVMIPIQNAVMTQKLLFDVQEIMIELINVNGVEYYELTWNIEDIDGTISNISLKVGKDKVYASEGKIRIKKSAGSPTTCDGELIISYALADGQGKNNYSYDVTNIQYKNTETFASSIVDRLDQMFKDMFE